MNLKALRNRLLAIRTEAKAIVDSADSENSGGMTKEQQASFDALMAEREQVEANIARLEQLESMDASAGRLAEPVVPASPDAGPTRGEVITDQADKDPMHGFQHAADFGRAVMAACLKPGQRGAGFDERLKIGADSPSNFHRETSSSDGYMVPPAMRDLIWDLIFADEGVLAAVSPEPTESNSVQLLRDESTPWSSDGIQANWASEGAQFTASRLLTEFSTVQLHKLHAFVTATDELVSDAPRLNARLTKGAAAAIRWKAEDAIVSGDGTGKPLGWQTSGALVTVAKTAGQAADTITAANVLKMFERLLSIQSAGAFWLAHKSTLSQLAQMTIGNQPIWTPPLAGLSVAPRSMLLGLPVVWSEHQQVLGDLNDINLVAPMGYYATVKSGGMKFAASMHLFFDHDVEAFRWTFRIGGQPFMSAPVTPANGSDTLGHFITLAERA